MTNKIIAKTELSLQVEESDQVLPDESDQIIADLKNQLSKLKDQLLNYEKAAEESPPLEVEVMVAQDIPLSQETKIQLQIKKYQIKSLLEKEQAAQHRSRILPHVVNNLQQPISQMTSDLQQLISNAQDLEVQQTLEQCLSVVKGVEQLNTKTAQLDAPITARKKQVELLSFFKNIARNQQKDNEDPIKLYASSRLPQTIYVDQFLFHKSILILLKEISRLSDDDTISITLKQGEEFIYDINVKQLYISLFGEKNWNLPPQTEMETFLDQTLEETEEWGLDVLYAKKIIEEHGGSLSFHHEKEEVVGFDITLPTEQQ
ncbi:MAG: hypothetical protein HQM14_16315 [SAR324 cluster bacterium]|nr:hypothetical protein [SAR324 cluster bacterium]